MKPYVALFVALFSVSISAQQPVPPREPSSPKTPQAPAAPAPPQASSAPAPPSPRVDPSEGGQPVNIRLDVIVNEQGVDAIVSPKTLMVILADRAAGQTRAAFEDRSISLDGRATIVDGRVRLNLTIQSRAAAPGNRDATLSWQNSFAVLLDSGKPMLAFETSDPATKRKLSIEVKATILK